MAEDRSLFYIPEALEEQILVRLPVKSILRFQSVCKRWCSLSRSKAFSEFYLGSGDHDVSIPTKADLRSIYPQLIHRRITREGICTTRAIGPLSNGIYALTSLLTPIFGGHVFLHTLKIALLNPATRRMKFATPFPPKYLALLTGISGIKSNKCTVSCGIDDDYRLVVLITYRGGGIRTRTRRVCFLAFLYTWRTGKWEILVDYNCHLKRIGLPRPPATRVFQKTFQVMDDVLSCSQKLFNGCWHWMTVEFDPVGPRGTRFGVLSFNFASKSFGLIPGPKCDVTHNADVFVLQDHLAAIVLDGKESQCEIWMKTTDPETTWTNVYRVNAGQNYTLLQAILHEVDYYPIQESEPIKIKRVVLMDMYERFTFDEKGNLLLEGIESSTEISFNVGGISKFTPTIEPLP